MAGEIVAIDRTSPASPSLPALIAAAGPAAAFVWEEFFSAGIRNPHTRRAYTHAVRRFLAWAETQGC